MLEKQDLQAIEMLLDKKLGKMKGEIIDEITVEICGAVNDAFVTIEAKFVTIEAKFVTIEAKIDNLSEEIKKRPTKEDIFRWGDRQINDLSLRTDRLDYLHINELDKLPAQLVISQTLADRGFKKNID